jgi:hypothetical protein
VIERRSGHDRRGYSYKGAQHEGVEVDLQLAAALMPLVSCLEFRNALAFLEARRMLRPLTKGEEAAYRAIVGTQRLADKVSAA